MDYGLKGKTAIVTGAGSQIGFGRVIATTLAKEGCNVVVTDIDMEGCKKTAAEIEALGVKSLALKVDVSNPADAAEMVKATVAKFGRIDILVNNAGVSAPPGPFMKMTDAQFKRDIDVNLMGTMFCTKAVLPGMIEQKKGKIVNITSGAGISGGFFTAGYSAAKAGVIAFSKCVAKEMAPNKININLVSPGVADTGFAKNAPPGMIANFVKNVPIGKLTEPQDIANAVVFLCSEPANQIVGQVIPVTGSPDP